MRVREAFEWAEWHIGEAWQSLFKSHLWLKDIEGKFATAKVARLREKVERIMNEVSKVHIRIKQLYEEAKEYERAAEKHGILGRD